MIKKCLLFLCAIIMTAGSIAPQASAIIDPDFFSSNSILYYDDECLSESSVEAVMLAGDDNEQKILNFFMRKGLSLAAAAGFVGNMQQESGLKPDIEQGGRIVGEDYVPRNGVGFGLVQWTFTARQAPLMQFTKEMGVPVTDLGGQLGFVWEELNSGYMSTLNKLRETDDPVDAAIIVHGATNATVSHPRFAALNLTVGEGYEASADSAQHVIDVRGGHAQEVYDKYRNEPALAGSAADDELQNPEGSLGAGGELGNVYIVGDSITEGAASLYEEEMTAAGANEVLVRYSGGGNLDNPGTSGTRQSGLDSIAADSDYIANADTIVIAHGTNNLSHTRQANAVIADTMSALDATETDARIFWVDVAITEEGPSQYEPIIGSVNSAIYAGAGANYMPISWAKVVDESYDPAADSRFLKHNDAYIQGDGIHLTAEGNAKLVETVIDAIINGQGESANANGVECEGTGFAGGNFNETLKAYAWSDHRGLTVEARPEYVEAYTTAQSEGRYIGGIRYPGIDCGGFVTLLVTDSGFDPGYNHEGRGGPTGTQEAWARENWQTVGNGASIDPAELQPGDVAFSPGHTFIFVGDVDGFESNIASSSLDERAPMAGNESLTSASVTWYRKG